MTAIQSEIKAFFSGCVPNFLLVHEDNNIYYHITQNFLGLHKTLGICQEFFGFVWKFFIVYEDNIIYLSNDTNIFGFLGIFCVCLEISSMCMEIRIVHKDCAIFILWHTNFQIAWSFLRVTWNLRCVFENLQMVTLTPPPSQPLSPPPPLNSYSYLGYV